MMPVPVLPTTLNRSRSSSNVAAQSRERSTTLASGNSTYTSSTVANVTMNPPDAPGIPFGTPSSGPPPVPAQQPSSVPVSARKEPPKPLDMADVLKYGGNAGRGVPATGKESGQNPETLYQMIQEASAKRISSLDYLKKTHEPRVFWFNTLLYTQPDIARMPSFSLPRMTRRATNFLLLGVSLPSVVDLNTQSPTDYLKALNSLLIEFEDYEKHHPVDGSATGSLTRQIKTSIWKRSGTISGKRRTSSAADIGLPMQTSDPQELKNLLAQNGGAGAAGVAGVGGGSGGVVVGGGGSGAGTGGGGVPMTPIVGPGAFSGVAGLPGPSDAVIPGGELAAGEDFSWLRTPSIPIEPDFFEVFVTLCDMLIECYSRIASLVSSPSVCGQETGDFFLKADGRIKKVVFDAIIKEFTEQTRAGARNEVAGISKMMLGGLM